MLDSIVQVSPAVMLLLPVIIGLAQLVKSYEYIPSRWIPLFVIVVSVVSTAFLTDLKNSDAIWQGLGLALIAMGAFTGLRAQFAPSKEA